MMLHAELKFSRMTNLRKVYETNLERKRLNDAKISSLSGLIRENNRLGSFIIPSYVQLLSAAVNRSLERARVKSCVIPFNQRDTECGEGR